MRSLAVLLLCLSTSVLVGQEAAARALYEKALAARPAAEKLRFYELNWATNLDEARQRAATDKRPIVLLYVTNITAGCDFFTGHT
jgi:hypothetical protein